MTSFNSINNNNQVFIKFWSLFDTEWLSNLLTIKKEAKYDFLWIVTARALLLLLLFFLLIQSRLFIVYLDFSDLFYFSHSLILSSIPVKSKSSLYTFFFHFSHTDLIYYNWCFVPKIINHDISLTVFKLHLSNDTRSLFFHKWRRCKDLNCTKKIKITSMYPWGCILSLFLTSQLFISIAFFEVVYH